MPTLSLNPNPSFPILTRSPKNSHVRRLAASQMDPRPLPRSRFAVLKTGHATDYTERTHGGYARMLERLLRDGDGDDEHWDIFSVVDGDFSFHHAGDDQILTSYDGFVITGSSADAHADDVPWILRLCDVIRILHRNKKKLLGICFGHQILARALDGETGRTSVGWELGMKSIRLDAEALSKSYGLELGSHLNVIESHRDQGVSALSASVNHGPIQFDFDAQIYNLQPEENGKVILLVICVHVLRVPPGGVVLASSEKTAIEMFSVGDNVLGIQCHPEFSKDVIVDIIHGRLSGNVISEEVANDAIQSLERNKPDQEVLQVLCKTFLKGNPKLLTSSC